MTDGSSSFTRGRSVDVVVVGAGIAGLSAAAEIARFASVAVVEAERTVAFHASGRSAAVFLSNYGNEVIRQLTAASRSWYDNRGEGATHYTLLTPRGALVLANLDDEISATGLHVSPVARTLSRAEAYAIWPALRPERIQAAWLLPSDFVLDIDVSETLTAWRRQARSRGATIDTSCRATALQATSEGWEITTGSSATVRHWRARVVVNAAGAWADSVAELAGLAPLGIVPLRRTALTFRAGELAHEKWPMLLSVASDFYIKPERGLLLASPADESPSAAIDARPDPIDLARTLDRVRRETTLPARSVRAAWAGLRSFAPDRSLVIGRDPRSPAFLWCAGQGGYGFQTAPACAVITALAAADALGVSSIAATDASANAASSGLASLVHPKRFLP